MKKIILSALTLASFGVFAQNGQQPNSNFENWTTSVSSAGVDGWFTNNAQEPTLASRSTDSQEATYAVQLETIDIDGTATAAQLAYGTVNASGFFMTEYTSPIDTFVVWLNYDFAINDSATIYVAQSVQGQTVPSVAIIGGSSNGYVRVAMPLASPTQDSIQILITTENLLGNDAPVAGSVLTVDNAFFTQDGSTPAALPNQSFENWTIEQFEDADDWGSFNDVLIQNGGTANTLKVETHKTECGLLKWFLKI